MIQFTKLINMIRSCNNSETSMQASVLFEITKLIRQVPRRYLIISKPSNSIKSFSVTFSCRFPICAFLICLSSLRFVRILLLVLIYCVVVFAYDFCDVVVIYHSIGGDRLCYIIGFYQDYLADLSKEKGIDDFLLGI